MLEMRKMEEEIHEIVDIEHRHDDGFSLIMISKLGVVWYVCFASRITQGVVYDRFSGVLCTSSSMHYFVP